MTIAEHMRRRRLRLKAAGLCQCCGDEPKPGITLCERCVLNRRRQREGIRSITKAGWARKQRKAVKAAEKIAPKPIPLEPADRVERLMRLAGCA